MATFTPTFTEYPDGTVTIVSEDNTPYSEIQESMGTENYEIKSIYYRASSIEQVIEPIRMRKYDANGNISNNFITPTIDPFQKQPVVNIDFNPKEYILDGKLDIAFNILPGQSIDFNVDTLSVSNTDFLQDNTKTFDQDFLKTYDFMQEYGEEIDIDFNYELDDEGVSIRPHQIPCD
jgi:hypothetical protein